MIPQPRSHCPINRNLEMFDDRWSLLIPRDIVLRDRRSSRDLLTDSEGRINAPVLSRRLTDFAVTDFFTKDEVTRDKRGRYSLTEQGMTAMPLLIELGRLGARIGPTTAHSAPGLDSDHDGFAERLSALRKAHIGT